MGLIALAAAAAAFAIWFQWTQTRRCLAFFGPAVARRIQAAPRVEVWILHAGSGQGRITAVSRHDVSAAPGLVHLRHGLVEDANYDWHAPGDGTPAWNVAVAFFDDDAAPRPAALVAFDVDRGGAMTVVGRPGKIRLGRLAAGLRKWLAGVVPGAAAGDVSG
ncbi:MAG: hypothetical protein ACKO4T_06460 [Planctomycetaceae bacterium]